MVAAFIVDRTPPEVHITIVGAFLHARESGAIAAVSSPNFTAAVTLSDSLTPDGASLQLQLRASGVTVRSSTNVLLTANVGGTRTSASLFSLLSDGEYVLEAQGQDGAGNPGQFVAATIVVDTAVPRVRALQRPAFTRDAITEICVAVVDTASAACTVTAAVDLSPGPLLDLPLTRSEASTLAGGAVFCGALVWGAFQGNATMVLVATDPAGNRGTNTSWLVFDSVPPDHTGALASNADCVEQQALTVCRDTARLAVDVSCVSGGISSTAAPCAVEWAVVVAEMLQEGSCGTSSGSSAANVTAPSGYWARAGLGASSVDVGTAVASAALGAGGDRLAVKVVVFVRGVDEAGAYAAAKPRCGLPCRVHAP